MSVLWASVCQHQRLAPACMMTQLTFGDMDSPSLNQLLEMHMNQKGLAKPAEVTMTARHGESLTMKCRNADASHPQLSHSTSMNHASAVSSTQDLGQWFCFFRFFRSTWRQPSTTSQSTEKRATCPGRGPGLIMRLNMQEQEVQDGTGRMAHLIISRRHCFLDKTSRQCLNKS